MGLFLFRDETPLGDFLKSVSIGNIGHYVCV